MAATVEESTPPDMATAMVCDAINGLPCLEEGFNHYKEPTALTPIPSGCSQ
jgi:hypothetical protein